MAGISQRLIQRKEAAHETLGVLGDRLGKVRALRRHRADQRHAAGSAVEVLCAAGPLVKLGKAAGQICGEALFCGHFLQTAGNLTQGLGPA
ncbi:hypothetical protein SDC9_187226 [bioreactor metagenome]|uniref:Uncharacterized protein n=1 Tax=bioreactor metagenome TaxID=1076179 RepID=A0A645HL37_9ZZZZ